MLKFSPTKKNAFLKELFSARKNEESFEILMEYSVCDPKWNPGNLFIYLFIFGQKCAQAASLIHY
jgi:hypothetical protein